MYSSFTLARKYLAYWLTAFNGKGHGMHSPFVFQLILDVLNNRQGYLPNGGVEALRRQLMQHRQVLSINDMGAGSRSGANRQRSVRTLVQSAVKPPKYGQLLFRLARHFQPKYVVELGTSLGLTTAYLAEGAPGAQVYSIEGSQQVLEVAARNLEQLGHRHVHLCGGHFDELLPEVLRQLPRLDLGYVDGNHRYEPTIRYFLRMLPFCHNDTVLVFDDIHWSAEMEQAWEEIRQHPSVRCSVDLFFLGLVFFRAEFREPRHFHIRF